MAGSYEKKNKGFLKNLAMDTADGHVFTSAHIPENQTEMLPMVFMPLVFLDDKARQEFKDMKITLLFEYLDKAGPRAINGFPSFFSLQMLDEEDAKIFWDFFDEIKAVKLKFLGKKEETMGGARADDMLEKPTEQTPATPEAPKEEKKPEEEKK